MTPSLIQPDELPAWVPGRLTVRSPDEGWDGVSVRGYRYAGSDVEVPPMRDYIVVAYRRGATPMRRRIDGSWIREELGPGDVHVYLTHDELTATCRQMYEREVAEVELLDEVKANDPLIHRTAMLIAAEARHDDAGSRLLVDSLSCQLAVYILRMHAHIVFREPADTAGLTFGQERIVRDYVREHLRRNIALNDLAAAVGLSRFHFARRFKQSTGQTPHAFVMAERLARSQTLLRRTSVPLPDVAAQCGFSDQSHMNRVFAKHLGITPGQYRVSS